MNPAQSRPGKVRHASRQLLSLLVDGGLRIGALCHEATADAFGHTHNPVGEQPAMVVVEPGVNERVDRLGDGVLHGA